MTCSYCREIPTLRAINSPERLWRAIEALQQFVADGIIEQAHRNRLYPRFMDLREGEGYPDFISYQFKCSHCGEDYEIVCETYHGRGGHWGQKRPTFGNESP